MSQVEPEWAIVKEAEEMVEKLCNMYPDKVGHVDPKLIGCAAITNKERPEAQDYDSKISGIKKPEALFTSKVYVVAFYQNVWDGYTQPQRSAMIMRNLLRIPEGMDGSLIKEDLKDLKCLVSAWGVDYINNPKLPDLTANRETF